MAKLSMWWREDPARGYVARRVLIGPEHKLIEAPFSHFEVYYCGAGFSTLRVAAHAQPESSYLIVGEKEPLDEEAESPWTRKRALELMGGVLRHDKPKIIPVLYVSMGALEKQKTVELTSDTVPMMHNAHYSVRVISGAFEKQHFSPFGQTPQITLLDVVLNQGGEFNWQVPAGQQVYVYVIAGQVSFGPRDQVPNCLPDTLVLVKGSTLYATAQCAGGRFLAIAAPHKGALPGTRAGYKQIALPMLDQVEN